MELWRDCVRAALREFTFRRRGDSVSVSEDQAGDVHAPCVFVRAVTKSHFEYARYGSDGKDHNRRDKKAPLVSN